MPAPTVCREPFELVTRHRNAEHADKIVTGLLRREQGTRELVGLTEGVERVVDRETAAKRLLSIERSIYGYDSSFSAMGTVLVVSVHRLFTGLTDVLGLSSVHERSFRLLELLPGFLEQTHR